MKKDKKSINWNRWNEFLDGLDEKVLVVCRTLLYITVPLWLITAVIWTLVTFGVIG